MTLLAGIRAVVLADRLVDFGGSMLARLGADVVLAGVGAQRPSSAAAWHHGMRAEGRPLEELIADADILLDDRRNGGLARVDAAAAANERLVHVVAVGWPDDERPVTDITLMAQSGLMKVIGWADRPPLRLPGEQAYFLTGVQAATAALMGLRARRLTGKGQRITLGALQSAVLANYRTAIMYDWTGKIGMRAGNLLVRGASGVQQVWSCADGFVTWAMVDNPGMMRAVVRVMEEEDAAGELAGIDWENILVADTDQALIDRWQSIFGAFFARHARTQLEDWSLRNGWGLSPIIKLAEVPGSPQMLARGVFVEDAAGRRVPGPLFAVHPAGGGG
jgi:crotonobetainyl-CoA:carnitine CoA-transferase CaiB-like acyl-CoA transferase